MIRFEVRNQLDNSLHFTQWSDLADQRRNKNSQRNSVPKVPPALCWCDLLQRARLVRPNQGLFWEHRASPWVATGWGLDNGAALHLALKRGGVVQRGEGRKAAGASSLCPGKRRAGNVLGPPTPTVKPQPGRGPPRTRIYWIAPCPAQGLPETPASGCPKKLWVSEEEEAPRTQLRLQPPERWDPGPSVQNFIQAPRPPSAKGKPRRPARMRTGCSLSPGVVTNAAVKP